MVGRSLDAIIRGLNAAGVRYLVVGGLAVVAHGSVRFTADLDLVVDFDEVDVRRTIDVLRTLGYEPRVPVPFDDFASAAARTAWRTEKGMTVFSIYSRAHAATEIARFVDSPFDFDAAYARAARFDVSPGVAATFVSLDGLIEMKRTAGRPSDVIDIQELEVIRRERDGR